MNTFKKTLVAAAVALSTGSSHAATILPGQNDIFYNNLENQYRTDAMCNQLPTGSCLGTGTGPAGWQMVNYTIAGNIVAGDVFAGVLRVQNIDNGDNSWVTVPGSDTFTGYFAQQVANIDTTSMNAAILTFSNVGADPFGILQAGEMFRFYTGSYWFTNATGGTVASIIGGVTGGTFWGSLGLTAGPNGSYAYAIDDLTAPGTATTTESYLGLNLVNLGASYNAGLLNLINDENESLFGGVTGSQICTSAELAAGAVCTEFVATSEIESNLRNTASPFKFASNDPATMNRIPEPGTLALMGLGMFGLAGLRRRKN